MNGRRAALLQKLVHFLTAFTVLMKAITKLEHPEGYWPVIVFLIAGSIAIATVTILHDRLHHHERLVAAGVFLIEAAVLGVTAWLYAGEGKRGLPWVFGFAAVMFLLAAIVRLTVKRGGNAPVPH
jgi:hypothetical protein